MKEWNGMKKLVNGFLMLQKGNVNGKENKNVNDMKMMKTKDEFNPFLVCGPKKKPKTFEQRVIDITKKIRKARIEKDKLDNMSK